MLARRNRHQAAAEDLGLIGGSVQGERQQGAKPRIPEEPPQADVLPEALERTQAVIQQEQLRQQRRTAEEVHVAGCHALQYQAARQAGKGQQKAEHSTQAEGNRHQLGGYQQAVDEARAVAFQQVGVKHHCQQLIEAHARAPCRWRLLRRSM
ncbi:hypothetical protein D3C79_804540 [compost metagenome]